MKLEYSLTSYTKINSKWIKDLNVRLGTHKSPSQKAGRTLFDIFCSNIFLALSPKAKEIKAKINKWGIIKLKSFCITKETTDNTKRQLTEWEKIFTNDMPHKGLVSKLYEQCIQLKIKKPNNPTKKCAEDLNRHFSKEDIQMA